jgi:hypothetical protein
MRKSSVHRSGFLIALGLSAALCVLAQADRPETQPKEIQGVLPRSAPTDYQAHAPAGTVTIAAEFLGHAVPTPQATFNSEDYVVVETALFGPPDAKTKLSIEDFSLRVNGKKMPLPSQPYALVFKSLNDPEWMPPDTGAPAKSKGGVSGGGGGGGQNEPPPPPPKMPLELRRAMERKVQKAALPEGDRPLPQAGLIFFQHRGKVDGIRSLELIYSGAAGKATLELQP